MIGILIVEDERIVAMALERALRRMGYMVTGIADTGEGAILKATQDHPDLVLMDIRLKGGMDGIQAADQIQRRLDVPVVYLTAYGDEETMQRATITAAYGYVLKPFEERDVRIAIEMALYKHLTEQKLKDRERWLEATLKSIGEAVVAADEMNMVRFVNLGAQALTGWPDEAAVGQELAAVVRLVDSSGNCITGDLVNEAYGQNAPAHIREGLLMDHGNSPVHVECSLAPVRDDRGQRRGVVAVLRDVGEHVRLRAQLQLSEEKYQSLLRAQDQPVLLVDLEGNVIELNDRMAEILETDPASAVGKSLHALDNVPAGLQDYLVRLAQGTTQATHRFTCTDREGNPRAFLVSGTVMQRGEKGPALHLVLRELMP